VSATGSATAQLLGSIERLCVTIRQQLESRVLAVRAAVYGEIRRLLTLIILAILITLLISAAVEFAAAAVLIAAWNSHPALAALGVAGGLLALALVAMVAIRRCTR